MSTLLAAYVKQLAIILLDLAESDVVEGLSRAECQACLQRFSGSSEESCLYVFSQGDGPSKSLVLTTEWSSEGHSMSARIALIKLRDRPIVDTEPISQQTQVVTGPTMAKRDMVEDGGGTSEIDSSSSRGGPPPCDRPN